MSRKTRLSLFLLGRRQARGCKLRQGPRKHSHSHNEPDKNRIVLLCAHHYAHCGEIECEIRYTTARPVCADGYAHMRSMFLISIERVRASHSECERAMAPKKKKSVQPHQRSQAPRETPSPSFPTIRPERLSLGARSPSSLRPPVDRFFPDKWWERRSVSPLGKRAEEQEPWLLSMRSPSVLPSPSDRLTSGLQLSAASEPSLQQLAPVYFS